MANIIEVILKANDQTGSTFSKLNSSFQSLTGFSLTAAGGIAMAGMAINKAVQYTKEAIDANDKYVSSIVDMARFTGDQTDAMSRLVQVADDVFLSQEALNNAMSIGAKKGLDMSVQGIKNLADQYNALGTQQEKNKLLNDNFGRSGLAMGKLLEQGSEGITKNMKAIESNLVVTQKSVQIAYDYKRSVDAATDAQDAFAYSVAQGTMPALTKLNTQWASTVTAINNSGAATKVLSTLSEGLGQALLGLQIIFSGYTTSEINSANAADIASDRFDKMSSSLVAVTQAEIDAAVASKALQDQYTNVTTLAGNLTTSDEELLIAETDLANYIKNNPWDTKGIQTRKDKVDELKETQQKMIDSWMLNVFTSLALADGKMSDDEAAFLLRYQVDTGLITQENADRATSYWTLAGEIFSANTNIQGSINSLTGKDIDININYKTNGISSVAGGVNVSSGVGAPAPKKRASGGDVYAGQSYWVGEQGPEPFIPKTDGTIISNKNAMGGMSDSQYKALLQAVTPNYDMMANAFANALSRVGR